MPLDLHHPDQHHSDQHHPRLSKALLLMLRHPIRGVLFHWNWKAALLSAAIRSAIFFGVNLRAGRISAVKAMLVEAVYAAWASGLFGAVTQRQALELLRTEPAASGRVNLTYRLKAATAATAA